MSDKTQVRLRYATRVGSESYGPGDTPHLPSWLARRMLQNGRAEAVSADDTRTHRADVGAAGPSPAAGKARAAKGGNTSAGGDGGPVEVTGDE